MHNSIFKYSVIFIAFQLCCTEITAQDWKAIPLVSSKILSNGHSGGEGCQWPQAIEVDQTDGSFLLFGTDVGGIYRSTNRGKLWEPCNIGYHPRGNCGFAIDPNNNQRALAIGGNSIENKNHGIYLSTNQAASWKHVLQEEFYNGYRDFKDKVAFDASSLDEDLGYSTIAYWSNPAGGLYKSIDGGETWKEINSEFGDCTIKVSPETGSVYAGTMNGFYQSNDGGTTFKQVFSGVVRDIAVVCSEPSKVWFTTSRELHVSVDNGETFSKIESTNFPDNVLALKVSPANPEKIVVCHSAGEYSKPIYISANGGITWQIAQIDNSNAFMPFNGRHHEFAWHPTDENKVWAFGGDWITSSSDGGKEFEWDANGYTGILVGGTFNFNISDPDLLYIASQDYNGAFTNNGGGTWKYCNASGHGWGGFTYGAYAADKNVLVTMVSPGWNESGLLTVSRDGGNTFTKTDLVCNGLKTGCGDAKDPDVIYFSEYVTYDRGETWQIMEGCSGVFIANLSGAKEVYGADGISVVRSKDKGITWENVVTLPQSVLDVATDHINNRLYVVTGGDRLFIYENEILTELSSRVPTDQFNNRSILTVAVDPNNPNMVYCAGPKNVYKTDASVKRSTDGGETWEIITPNLRTNNGANTGDGANEVFALRVNPKTRELWGAGGCYGIWKFIPENNLSINLTAPAIDTILIAPGNIILTAEIIQNSYSVEKVEFFYGDTVLMKDTIPPYQYEWQNIETGEYEIYAAATDSSGNIAYSGKIKMQVIALLLPEVVVTSPLNDEQFEYDSTIEIVTEANDLDGQVIKVEFFANDTKLGEKTDGTFSFIWENVVDGFYTIIVKVTDNTNQTVTSNPIKIVVQTEEGSITYFEDFNDNLAQDWIPVFGEWSVQFNQFNNLTSNGMNYCIYQGTTFADFTFSAKVKSDWNNNFGLIFNFTDDNNFYLVELDAEPQGVWLKMVKDGNESTISTASYSGGGVGVFVTIEVKNDGSYTTVIINGNTIFDEVLTPDLSFGKIGLYTWWNPVWFDDVSVIAKGTVIFDNVSMVEKDNMFSIFPNPVSGNFVTVKTNSSLFPSPEIHIYSLEGKLLHSGIMTSDIIKLSTQSFQSPGIYLARLIKGNNCVQKKIVIQ
ncbi:VPS10 domain-containing protein [Mariniphaga sp.]|uniref:VPS10 domain-containing protein n=1 Tax=Mariniphaga sp. TaxID=1954475 RepID=UPI003564A9BA